MVKYDKKIEKVKSILEEGYEYDIKKLKLKKADELYYLKKLSDKFGQYSENIPRLKNTKKGRGIL